MRKTNSVIWVTYAVALVVIFLLDTAYAQFNIDNTHKAPFVSTQNSQQSLQSVIQNSEKDIVFIENLGQIRDTKGKKRPDVLFLTRSQGVDMYITRIGLTYVFRKTEGDIKDRDNVKDVNTSLYRLDMEFVGMNKNFKIRKELPSEQQFNYYTPEYPDGISPKAYKKITIENIYDGIDLVYYEKEEKMKYDFILKAGANVKNIKMKYEGAGSVYLEKDGSVIVTTSMGEIREEKPYTYSKSTGLEIESGYKVNENVVQFDIAEYNKSEDIIIDPFRIWATYYGGSSSDIGYSICTDNFGNLYVAGYTHSTNFPTKALTGAYNDTTLGGNRDAFILKFNSSGARMWATYYGGSNYEYGQGICTDNSGALYVTGRTRSTNFPTQTLTGAYNQTTLGGDYDVFILKFNSSGARIWATYYGGIGDDQGWAICTDTTGALYVTGRTYSPNFPTQTLSGAYNQTTLGGSFDVFILRFNSSGARIWATYYGGSSGDYGDGICTDNTGALYVTGNTLSTNLPTQTLTGAYNDITLGGSRDAFILKFNNSGVRLWATYYGGNNMEAGYSTCTDNSGNLYVTGNTWNTDFPTQTLAGAYNQTTFGGGLYDAFILKFNSSSARVWATYYGGNSHDLGYGICTDNSGALYVTGGTKSTNFPTQTITGAYNQTTLGGNSDAFLLKFNNSSARLWATYYGGNGSDYGYSILIDNSLMRIIAAGSTLSTNFPTQTLTGAYNDSTLGGNNDVFILMFGTPPSSPVLISPSNGATLVATNPLLDWDSSAFAESYRIQVSTDSGFSSTVYDSSNITITEFQIPNNGLNINTTYYWRVNAMNVAGTSPYSTIFHFTTGATNISGNNEIPEKFRLYNNYPNPFNPTTNIKFDIPKLSFVKIVIYNVLGKEITNLVNDKLSAGRYEVNWNGFGYPSGVYLYKLVTTEYVDVKKMLLIK